jgi:outer membrane protein TolC
MADVSVQWDVEDTHRTVPLEGDIDLTLSDAVFTALENNVAFRINRLEPRIRKTLEAQERALFDPVLGAELSSSDTLVDETDHQSDSGESSRETAAAGGLSIREFLPTGTTIEAGVSRAGADTDGFDADEKQYRTSYDIRVTQSLLRGFGPDVNLARLRQARLDTRISRHELAAAAETLVAQVEETYWNYLLARKSIEIYQRSLDVSEQQLQEVRDRVLHGAMAETEVSAAEADVAARKESLIDARGRQATVRLRLLRLLNPGGASPWNREISLIDDRDLSGVADLDAVEAHIALAMQSRHDLAQARLLIERGDLEVVRTRNGLLPRLDLFAKLGGTEYSQSFSNNPDADGDSRDVTVGLSLQYALGRRSEKAAYERSLLSLRQVEDALVNLKQLVQVDVRSAYIEVQRSAEQIAATAATRKHRDATLETERVKLRAGKSTTLLVSQAWRDAIASRIAELEARIQHRIALIRLYRLEGSLLKRRGIEMDSR